MTSLPLPQPSKVLTILLFFSLITRRRAAAVSLRRDFHKIGQVIVP